MTRLILTGLLQPASNNSLGSHGNPPGFGGSLSLAVRSALAAVAAVAVLSGCQSTGEAFEPLDRPLTTADMEKLIEEGRREAEADMKVRESKPIVVRASGFGTYAQPSDARSQRKRLLAMRASKLDAYRALAERIYGTAISGTSSVNDLVLEHDSIRTLVDSVIRGARVLSTTELAGGGFETLIEVALDARFQRCLTSINYFRYDDECRLPLPSTDPRLMSYSGHDAVNWAGGPTTYDDSSYQPHMGSSVAPSAASSVSASASATPRPVTADERRKVLESARKGSGLYAPDQDRPQGQ